jgi:hypothetical protein
MQSFMQHVSGINEVASELNSEFSIRTDELATEISTNKEPTNN